MKKQMVLFIILIFTYMNTSAQTETKQFIAYEDAYSVYITKDLKASKEFYVRWLDFEIVFESTWFVYFQSKGHHKISFALIDEQHPSTPPSYGAFDGKGSFLTLQVADAAQVYHELKSRKAPIIYPLKKEDWGQIRFGILDPNGLYIDIVQQIEPAPGYWDKYLPK